MFAWFRSKAECPVDPQAKEWLERRMAWLADEFGWERLRSTRVILPTPEFFPDPFAGTAEDARVMFDRVCGYMGIQPETVELSLYEERNPVHEGEWRHGTAGLYHEEDGKFRVWVEASNLNDPLAMVGTLAHELGHVHLLGHGRITEEAEDHEPLTDLLTVFLGMGMLTANSVIREKNWHDAYVSGWSMSRRGYLSMPMYGYAFALFAWARGEVKPPWAKELRPDVRSAFQQGVQFLTETNDSVFQPNTDRYRDRPGSDASVRVEPLDAEQRAEADRTPGPDRSEEFPEGRAFCAYCDAELDPQVVPASRPVPPTWQSESDPPSDRENELLGICQECQGSIDEHGRDIQEEEQAMEEAQRLDGKRASAIYLVTFGIMSIIVLLALLGVIG